MGNSAADVILGSGVKSLHKDNSISEIRARFVVVWRLSL